MSWTHFPGIREPAEVLAELERKRKCREDYVLPSSRIALSSVDKTLKLTVLPEENREFVEVPMTNRALAQLFDLVGLPQRTRCAQWLMKNVAGFKRNKEPTADENHDLLCNLVTAFFSRLNFNRLVRLTRDAKDRRYCRAILSNRYRIVDSYDLFFAILEELSKIELGGKHPEIWGARLSEDHFYGYAVAPGITAQVASGKKSKGELWKGMEGDAYNAAIVFGNSETGSGGISIRHAVVRKVSRSYTVGADLVSERHVGGKLEADADLSSLTIQQWNKAFFSEIKDHVRNAFDPDRFQAMIDRLNGAAQEEVEDGVTAVDALQVCYDLSDATKTKIRNMFFKGGNLTRYGLITAVAEAAGSDVGAEEGSSLEQVSADLTQKGMADVYKHAATNRESKAPKGVDLSAAAKKPVRRRRRRAEPVA